MTLTTRIIKEHGSIDTLGNLEDVNLLKIRRQQSEWAEEILLKQVETETRRTNHSFTTVEHDTQTFALLFGLLKLS